MQALSGHNPLLTQRVHVGIWYILRAQRGSHIPTLRAKCIPYSYMDPLGLLKDRAPIKDVALGQLLDGSGGPLILFSWVPLQIKAEAVAVW